MHHLNKNSLSIREAHQQDFSELGRLMFAAVRNGPSRYTESQRSAWVPAPRCGPEWDERLERQCVLMAMYGEQRVGFMSVEDNGYIDFAYVLPAYQGQGIFRPLYQEIESAANQNGVPRLWVHASLNAEDAFRAMGFNIVLRESVEIGDQRLDRAQMEKLLSQPAK